MDEKKVAVVCGAVVQACVCILAPHDNKGPHVCKCGGSWEWENGENDAGEGFIVHSFPGVI